MGVWRWRSGLQKGVGEGHQGEGSACCDGDLCCRIQAGRGQGEIAFAKVREEDAVAARDAEGLCETRVMLTRGCSTMLMSVGMEAWSQRALQQLGWARPDSETSQREVAFHL